MGTDSDTDDVCSGGECKALLSKSTSRSSIEERFPAKMETEKGRTMASRSVGLSAILHYPKGVFFCLGNEFSERFSYYGMRAVLTLYLITIHQMDASTAKLVFHAFVSVAYFTPLLGSILADGFLGRYRVILYVSILYCFGHLLLSAGAVVSIGSTIMKVLDFGGLFIIALSTGGIKPCVSAFAADQFPETMHVERKQFFSFFYFSINVGALLSKIITPILRRHHCLGHDNCFPMAFGIPAIFMVIATAVFWAGNRYYKIVPKQENVIVRVFQCVVYSIRERANQPKKEANSDKHWLDYAKPKYDQELIDDIKTIIRILVLYIPVVFFWSLFDQLGSTWVLQANAMNGRVGKLTLLPDQMPVLNPFLIIVLVPVLEGAVYPLLSTCNVLVRPLRRMGWGGLLAAVSFAMAGIVQLKVDKTRVVPPEPAYGRLVLVNYVEQQVSILAGNSNFTLVPEKESVYRADVPGDVRIQYASTNSLSTLIPVEASHSTLAVLFSSTNVIAFNYDLKKTIGGKTRLYGVMEEDPGVRRNTRQSIVIIQNGKVKGQISNATSYVDLEPELWGSNVYDIYLKSCPKGTWTNITCPQKFLLSYTAEMGAAEVIIVRSDGSARVEELIRANTVSVLWQMPQYLVITVGEALFSITGLEFSYSEASPQMKSVLTAIWLLTTAFGNVIDMIISGSGMIKNDPAAEFFVYAALMIAVMMVFIVLAWRYKPASGSGSRGTNMDDGHGEPHPMNTHPSGRAFTASE